MLAPKTEIRETFGFEPWVIPVHRHPDRCHRQGLQHYADDAGRELLDARNPEGFEERITTGFYRGYLPACLQLRRYAWMRAREPVLRRQNLLFALNAAAGCGQGETFMQEVSGCVPAVTTRSDADLRLYAAAARANFGDLSAAVSACHDLEGELPRVRPFGSLTYPKLVRMRATVAPSIHNAREALRIAQDSPDPNYHRRTSKLTLASAYEAQGRWSAARQVAEDLSEDFGSRSSSWWHRIQRATLWARAAILSERQLLTPRALRPYLVELLRAQYAAALLDFVGIPIPDFRRSSSGAGLARITPTAVVHWVGRRAALSRHEMADLRSEAIFGDSPHRSGGGAWPVGLQADVLNTLRHGLRWDAPTQSNRERAGSASSAVPMNKL